jgi:IS30 family transposase
MEKKIKQLRNSIHPNLKKIIWDKIHEDLKPKNIIGWKNELWVLDLDSKEWYITITSEGTTHYNQEFFKLYNNLFSVSGKELSPILKEWLEKKFEVRLTNVSRRQSNMTYYIDGMTKSNKNSWTIKSRFGFAYEFVNKFLKIKEINSNILVEDFISFKL